MKIKILLISSNKKYYDYLTEFLTSYDNTLLETEENPEIESIAKRKFDIIVSDSNIIKNWSEFHQTVKHSYINNIFILILEHLSIENIKKAFKEGIYDILTYNSNKEEVLSNLFRAFETAKILKSTEKINQYCTHLIDINLPSDVNLVNETVLQIIDTLKITGFIQQQDTESNLRLVLTEAIANAIVHGNKSDNNKKVAIKVKINHKKLKISIEDMGKGFDLEKVENPIDADNLLKSSGRGIYLMKSIMDEIIYEKNGSKVILVKLKEDSMG